MEIVKTITDTVYVFQKVQLDEFQATATMIKDMGIGEKYALLGEWGGILFSIIFAVAFIRSYAMDLVYYLRMISDPDKQSVRYMKSRFDIWPENWKDCTNLAWTRKGMRIHIGSLNRITSISNTGLNGKDILVHTESSEERALVARIIEQVRKEDLELKKKK